ncbi:MAG: hypothetical protein R6W67_01105 [Bacteroidales bacterium]
MPELSRSQIAIVSDTVRAQEIIFSHLPDDLIDHICCDIEYMMQQGISFAEASAAIRRKMGSYRRLREIQEETLYAVDTKYRKMKTTMKISGIAGTILFGLASMFKIMHWPMAGMMFVLGALTLALVFMPSALGVLWKESRSPKRLFLFISAFLTALFVISGILFKVQHWPGAGIIITLAGATAVLLLMPAILHSTLVRRERKAAPVVYIIGAIAIILCLAGFFFKLMHWPLAGMLIVAGLLTLFLIALPWYVITTMQNDTHVRPEFIFMVVGSMAVLIPASLIGIDGQFNYEQGYYSNIKSTIAMSHYLSGTNDIIAAGRGDSATTARLHELHSMTGSVVSAIESLEAEMVAISDENYSTSPDNLPQITTEGSLQTIDYNRLRDPFTTAPARQLIASRSPWFERLEDTAEDLKNYLSANFSPEKIAGFSSALTVSEFIPSGDSDEMSLMTALHSLMLMKNAVLTAENILLRDITDAM